MVSNDPPNEVKDGEADPPPSKIVRFELNIKSNLTEYANTFIQNFASTQTVTERILVKNPVSANIKGENLLGPYLQELMVEQNKGIPLSQDKSLFNLQQKIVSVYEPVSNKDCPRNGKRIYG